MIMRVAYLAIAVIALDTTGLAQLQPGTTNNCESLMNAANVRRHATKTVRPVYPEEAIRDRITGVVVAEICVPRGSTVAAIRISSAPSNAIAQSVKRALSQWAFRPMFQNGRYVAYGGKIIVYFVQQNNVWEVLEPSDAFYVGPRFAIEQQHPVSY